MVADFPVESLVRREPPSSPVTYSWGEPRPVPYETSSAPPTSTLPVGEGGLRVVGRRVDALTVGLEVEADRAKLREWFCACSPDLGSAVGAVEVGMPGFWIPESLGGGDSRVFLRLRRLSPSRFAFENGDVWGVLDERKQGGCLLEVSVRATYLAQVPLASALAYVRRIGEALGVVVSQKLRRLDLACDVAGWQVQESERAGWLKRPRSAMGTFASLEDSSRDVVHGGAGGRPVTGFTVSAGGPVMCRVYDKPAELAAQSPHKKALEEGLWKAYGWDGESPVTRVEFQLRAEALTTFELRDPALVEVSLDPLWQYLTREWLKLVQPGTASRLSRCALDPRWALLQKVVFVHEADPARRQYLRKGASAKHALGGLLSFSASKGLDFGRVALARAFDGEAGELRAYLATWLEAGAEALAAELEREGGAAAALDYLHERAAAAMARASVAGELLEGERAGGEVPRALREWKASQEGQNG